MKALKHQGISLMVLGTLAVIGMALTPAPVSAQTSIFMKVYGIDGSSTDPKHLKWINVASFGQSASNPPSSPSAGTQGAARVNGACDVEVLKGLDAAGPKLWLALFQGDHIEDIVIEVWMTRPAGDQVKVYEVHLLSARITSIVAAGATTFAETVKLSGDRIHLIVYPFNPNGTPIGTVESGWDCTANKRF